MSMGLRVAFIVALVLTASCVDIPPAVASLPPAGAAAVAAMVTLPLGECSDRLVVRPSPGSPTFTSAEAQAAVSESKTPTIAMFGLVSARFGEVGLLDGRLLRDLPAWVFVYRGGVSKAPSGGPFRYGDKRPQIETGFVSSYVVVDDTSRTRLLAGSCTTLFSRPDGDALSAEDIVFQLGSQDIPARATGPLRPLRGATSARGVRAAGVRIRVDLFPDGPTLRQALVDDSAGAIGWADVPVFMTLDSGLITITGPNRDARQRLVTALAY